MPRRSMTRSTVFPFLFGGTFIEGSGFCPARRRRRRDFPSFSEGLSLRGRRLRVIKVKAHFPSFSEGLLLRGFLDEIPVRGRTSISLPFPRDLH